MARATSSGCSARTATIGRAAVVIAILLLIALTHILRIGSYLEGRLFTLYYSFFSDVVVPFGMYFLLCLNDITVPWLRDWRLKVLFVFTVASLTEVMQGFGVPILGETFDPLDFPMFAAGVLLAAFVDRMVLERVFRFWSPEEA